MARGATDQHTEGESFGLLARVVVRAYNTVHDMLRRVRNPGVTYPALAHALTYPTSRSAIGEHLPALFAEAVSACPKLIVELGVEHGHSTQILLAAANLTKARLLSVDINDCSRVSDDPGWIFVQSDDVAFAAQFADFARQRGLPAQIDVLFIDTSHEFEHTQQEIQKWFAYLAPQGTALFHDTNMRRVYRRLDGSVGLGTDNRGVFSAIEGFLGRSYDETLKFTDYCDGWLIQHTPTSSGFTILRRISV